VASEWHRSHDCAWLRPVLAVWPNAPAWAVTNFPRLAMMRQVKLIGKRPLEIGPVGASVVRAPTLIASPAVLSSFSSRSNFTLWQERTRMMPSSPGRIDVPLRSLPASFSLTSGSSLYILRCSSLYILRYSRYGKLCALRVPRTFPACRRSRCAACVGRRAGSRAWRGPRAWRSVASIPESTTGRAMRAGPCGLLAMTKP